MPTGTWPTPQNAERPYLKFRLGTYVPDPLPLREPLHQPSMWESSLGHSGGRANKEWENQSTLESLLAGWDQHCLQAFSYLSPFWGKALETRGWHGICQNKFSFSSQGNLSQTFCSLSLWNDSYKLNSNCRNMSYLQYIANRLNMAHVIFFLQYSLRQEPYIDIRGQRPIPATI